jgi:hypothetical protein
VIASACGLVLSGRGTFGSPFSHPRVYGNRNGWHPLETPPAGASQLQVRSGCGNCYLDRLDDLAALDALSANLDSARSQTNHHSDGLKVGHPAPLAAVISMTDVIARRRSLATDSADPRHDLLPKIGSVTAGKYSSEESTGQHHRRWMLVVGPSDLVPAEGEA